MMMVEYILHPLSRGLLGPDMLWASYAVLEYTDFGDGKHLTGCQYFKNEDEAEAYRARKEGQLEQATTAGTAD